MILRLVVHIYTFIISATMIDNAKYDVRAVIRLLMVKISCLPEGTGKSVTFIYDTQK